MLEVVDGMAAQSICSCGCLFGSPGQVCQSVGAAALATTNGKCTLCVRRSPQGLETITRSKGELILAGTKKGEQPGNAPSLKESRKGSSCTPPSAGNKPSQPEQAAPVKRRRDETILAIPQSSNPGRKQPGSSAVGQLAQSSWSAVSVQ